ncbi:hypothetical protein ASPZODRAFT_136934 [Penicilliopsis zonata CBS 506.65]|uniref:AAA+ ATPase domain-containing protein n=1 Tax=Penicilliopsis zonata CBS 506.65 TaxID=1073090 RepID=A0A1L9S6J3_9EURO|nr:hypothetical protein ASPZODRAFT_136934 [Penicilliopsis zonata CBS 506.65]OJJ42804.1 hypothetical protein ASPZODRAFT_136934 [Penicilliopsis zonata CBS 506.65]
MEADHSHEASRKQKKEGGAWIRYGVEYCDRRTGRASYRKTISQEDFEAHTQGQDESHGTGDPAFELVAKYQIDSSKTNDGGSNDGDEDHSALPQTWSSPSYYLRISSVAIVNSLRSVVKYYPSQDLTGDTLIINWPYPVLVHHYEELTAFRDQCAAQDPTTLCVRNRDAAEHLSLLLRFLDENVMDDVRAERERNEKGLRTWEGIWVALKPGATALIHFMENDHPVPAVIHSVQGGIFASPPIPWEIEVWSMVFDGKYLGRVTKDLRYAKFNGETELAEILCSEENFEKSMEESQDPQIIQMVKEGEQYWKFLRKQCQYYKGKACHFPFSTIDGLVMTDPEAYYSEFEGKRPCLMGDNDCQKWINDCICSVCRKVETAVTREHVAPFENKITLESWEELTPHQYFLCPKEMPVFVFRTRTWETVHVRNCAEPMFDREMINSLVMDEQRVRNLKALAKSFARIDKNEGLIARESWTADFVKGKGNGLIFLLHGRPGVGKTCTAECIAEYTRRPLMVLTCSDIGTKPEEVEMNLTKHFKMARSWGAVLLIDEADVFMERRSTADLTRNSLVAGFLRALEFYDGILFLTTNRVGSFDDAFISRIHIQLYYPDFTNDQRQQVWKTFMDKLQRERGDCLRLTIDAKEYIRGERMRAVKWNGREIRNAFQTAVALAEYDAEKDEEGRVMVTDSHLRAVVELSKDFKDYLNDLHHGDEAKRAERKYERLDSYS